MTIQSLPGFQPLFLPLPYTFNAAAPAFHTTNATIDASTEKHAFIIEIPKTGTLDGIECGFRTVSINAASVVRVSFQTVDAATGDPDGTQDEYRDLATDPATDTWHSTIGLITSDGTDTGTKRSVTAGDLMAIVFEFQTFTAADSVVVASVNAQASQISVQLPYQSLNTGTWAKTAAFPAIVLKYNDATVEVPTGCIPASALNVNTFNSSSTPSQRGLKFAIPFTASLTHVMAHIDLDGDVEFVLYNAAGTTLATAALDKDIRTVVSGHMHRFRFASAYTLVAGTTYYLLAKPTTVTNLSIYDFDAASAGNIANYISATWHYTTCSTPGTYSDTTTKVPFIYPGFCGFDDGASSGGGYVIGS